MRKWFHGLGSVPKSGVVTTARFKFWCSCLDKVLTTDVVVLLRFCILMSWLGSLYKCNFLYRYNCPEMVLNTVTVLEMFSLLM